MRKPTFARSAVAAAIAMVCFNAQASHTEWVSTINNQSFAGKSNVPDVSGDGNIVVFTSTASGLFNGTGTILFHALMKNSQTGQITLLATNAQGVAANGHSNDPRVSANGRYVVFESFATNLAPADTNATTDVYLRDLQTGTIKLVSSNASGQVSNAHSHDGVVSDDGRYVAFASMATNLVSTNTNNKRQIYLKDLVTGTVELISKNAAGQASDNDNLSPEISTDGRYVVFNSIASNLDGQSPADQYDIYLFDRLDKSVKRLAGMKNSHTGKVSISYDGRIVAFVSQATDVVANDTNGFVDVFVLDRKTGNIERIQGSAAPNGRSLSPHVSGDGRFVTFTSDASNLVASDSNGVADQFVYDRFTKQIQLVSVGVNGQQGTQSVVDWADINKDGTVVAFTSSDALHSSDTNGQMDVYARHLDPAPNVAPVAKATQPIDQACSNGGAYVSLDASQSYDPDNQSLTYSWSGPFGTLSGSAINAFFGVGSHTVTLTVTDASGTSSTDSIIVNVVDNQAPTVSAGADVVVEATSTQGAQHNVAYTAADSCSLNGVTVNPTPQYYPLGNTTVTVTAFDKANHSASDSMVITVRDTTLPSLTIPTDKVIEATALPMSVNIGNAQASDIFPVTVVNNAPATFPLGQSLITWTATDANGNKRSAQQKITVRDTIAPSLLITQGDAVLEATSRGGAPYSIGYNVSDSCVGCGTINVLLIPSLSIYPLGITPVSVTATDHAGNKTSKQVSIKVQDTIAPTLTIPADVTREANDINSSINIGSATATDIFDVTISNNAPIVYPLGQTQVRWTATDSNGNSRSATQRVSLVDTTAPVLTLPADISVEASAILTSVNIGNAIAKDIFGISLSNDAPSAFPLGSTIVNWLATDDSGNIARGKQTVRVVDTTAPALTLPADISVEASARLTPVSIGNAIAKDIFGTTLSNDAPSAFPLGSTIVNWLATDDSGNIARGKQTVRVVDTTAPVLTLPADVVIEATGALTSVVLGQATATDIFNVTISNNGQSGYALGSHSVLWTARDENGNVSQKSQSVKVIDTTAPVVTAGIDMVVEATSAAGAAFVPSYQASDICDCGAMNIQIVPSLPVYPLGQHVITVNASDASGNTGSDSMLLKVVDTTKPVLNVPADLVVEASGELTTINIGQATASDLFAVNMRNNAPAAYPLGTTLVEWVATDANGNSRIGVQRITVVDTTAPSFALNVLRDRLWSPNHKLVLAAKVQNIRDLVDGKPKVDIQISSSGNQPGRGHDRDRDWLVEERNGEWLIYLRAEKDHKGKDRLYNISVNVSDFSGNMNSQSAQVSVDKDKHDERDHDRRDDKKSDRKDDKRSK
ncbi:MAG: HYR domain-containing protein [Gammaproteobacteria bacterium]|nr:HYR domain-containing protein [Gammaproteobacteria bacterium]